MTNHINTPSQPTLDALGLYAPSDPSSSSSFDQTGWNLPYNQPYPHVMLSTLQQNVMDPHSHVPLFLPNQTLLAPKPMKYAYPSTSELPYPILASHLYRHTPEHPQPQPHRLPGVGAPDRQHSQRLHAARMHPFRTKDFLASGRFNNRGQWHVQGSAPLQLGPVPSHVPVQGFQGSQCQGVALPTQYLSHLPVYVSPSYANTNAHWASNPPRFDQLHHAGATFTIIYRLGEGSAGRVVLGEHGGRPYAIKAIHQRRAKRTHTHRDNFLRERNFMIKIGHSAAMSEFRSYLVPLLMSWEEEGALYDGRIFFVMVCAQMSFVLMALDDRNSACLYSLSTLLICTMHSSQINRCRSRIGTCTVRSW